jgi:hypothetical protein
MIGRNWDTNGLSLWEFHWGIAQNGISLPYRFSTNICLPMGHKKVKQVRLNRFKTPRHVRNERIPLSFGHFFFLDFPMMAAIFALRAFFLLGIPSD